MQSNINRFYKQIKNESRCQLKEKYKQITEIEEKGNFRVRKLVIETFEKYPQVVALDFTQNNVGLTR